MPKYRLSQVAKDDVIRIYRYGVARFGEHQATVYFEKLFRCFDVISERPYAFEAVDEIKIGYRRCVCGVESIYYRIVNNSVAIMMILGRQDLNEVF